MRVRIGTVKTGTRHNRLRLHRFWQEPGQYYHTPKEVRGILLRSPNASPTAIAVSVLVANADLLGLEHTDLKRRHVVESLGAWHIIFSQEHDGRHIHRAYVSVHMNRQKEVYLVRNGAVPKRLLPSDARFTITLSRARAVAHRAIRRDPRTTKVVYAAQMWLPKHTRLRPSYKFRISVSAPAEDWIIYVDAQTGRVVSKYDNLSNATGWALVFNPNPVVSLGDWRRLRYRGKPILAIPEAAYEKVTLRKIKTSGILEGPRVNVLSNRLRRPSLTFAYASADRGFEEVMAYYHLDRAVRYIESLGYRGRRTIFGSAVKLPLRVNARDESYSSWYSSATKEIGFGSVSGVNDAEDGETILHEFGHAVQDAICPEFGQSPEAAAIGEGFGDYLAGSCFLSRKAAKSRQFLAAAIMSWNAIGWSRSSPPCIRRLDGGKTFKSFDAEKDYHENGTIWSATLWDILQRVGRDVADRIIIESHFQLDAHTRFARAARGILDADRNLFRGRHQRALRRIFRRRAIGPV
jgi:hypothetical protein